MCLYFNKICKRFKEKILKKIILFLILYILFVYVGNFINIIEVKDFLNKKEYFKSFVYFINYFLSVLSVLYLLLNKYTKIPILFLIFLTIIIELGYRNLSPLGFGYDDVLLIIQEFNTSLVQESFISYGAFFIVPFFISFVIVVTYILI